MSDFQLAQLNVDRAVGDLDSAALVGFVSRLDEINALEKRLVQTFFIRSYGPLVG